MHVRFFAVWCCAALLGLAPSALRAQDVYNLDAVAQCWVPPAVDGLPLDLLAGLYTTLPVAGAFNAWNAWGGSVSGCDGSGYDCSTGWATAHTVSRPDRLAIARTPIIGEVAENPALALLRPRRMIFRIYGGEIILLGIADSTCGDNIGGVSVRVEPAVCEADLNLDGSLDLFDLLEFQNAFDVNNLVADFDGDGVLTIFDFLAFQNAFSAGC
ncbi:MAG: hypothetical protein NCW75_12145 [Phycisphaera sp.]|nr:MAG: hypothetical protein NCW75_12145 [Phycisphaera sp.]